MARKKHKPQRTCIGCRTTKHKRDLIRIVRTPKGSITVDVSGKMNGRGVYLCRQEACWALGLKQERLSQALKVAMTSDQVVELRADVEIELSKV